MPSGRRRPSGWKRTSPPTRRRITVSSWPTTHRSLRWNGGRAKVTAGLFGHDHNYQHYLKNGIHYVVSGGGGAPLYDVNKPDPAITRKVVSIENFVSISVNGKTAKAQAIDINGNVIDEFEFNGTGQ